jgi:hypothetical protein
LTRRVGCFGVEVRLPLFFGRTEGFYVLTLSIRRRGRSLTYRTDTVDSPVRTLHRVLSNPEWTLMDKQFFGYFLKVIAKC